MDLPIRDVLDKGIPQTPVAAQAFLRFLMQQGQIESAETTWKWMADRSLDDTTIAGEYVSFLILKRRIEGAAETWGELYRANIPEYRHTNWIFNGGFESPFRPSPLDWHVDPNENVRASRVLDVAHEGRSSLGLGFPGNANVDYHVWQQAVLPPGKWKLQAFVKTDSLTTDQGISLRISDALQPQRLDSRTDPVMGTHEWTKVERAFAIGAKTTLVQVEIMRQASLRIDNKIAGKAWIDAVELRPTH